MLKPSIGLETCGVTSIRWDPSKECLMLTKTTGDRCLGAFMLLDPRITSFDDGQV